MNFVQAIKSGFTNYVNFSGRAMRSEYWFWVLFTLIGVTVTEMLDVSVLGYDFPPSGSTPLNGVFNLLTFIPSLALCVRRLHDIGRSGWWLLILLTFIGAFLIIYWACVKGTEGPNRFGPDPLAALSQISPHPAT